MPVDVAQRLGALEIGMVLQAPRKRVDDFLLAQAPARRGPRTARDEGESRKRAL